jgi:protein-S-isoprenylcysteine O-methyltransferase Ste14
VLSLPVVQICVAVAVIATIVGFVSGRARLPLGTGPVEVVATRPPARGTQVVWVGGTVVALFWGIGVFIVPAYAYHWPAFPDFTGSWVVQVVGIVLTVAGGLLYSKAARALGRQMTPLIRIQKDHQLLQTGPYRYIRHPVYTAIMTIAIGQSLFFLSLPVALIALVLVGLAVYRSGLEEALLRSPVAFGAEYEAYQARTGRFLPRFASRANPSA